MRISIRNANCPIIVESLNQYMYMYIYITIAHRPKLSVQVSKFKMQRRSKEFTSIRVILCWISMLFWNNPVALYHICSCNNLSDSCLFFRIKSCSSSVLLSWMIIITTKCSGHISACYIHYCQILNIDTDTQGRPVGICASLSDPG